MTEVTQPNGVSTVSVYDEAGRLAETTSSKGEEPATVLESLEYGYDPAGGSTTKLDRRLETETTYAYDALDRLTELNPLGEGSTGYGYDKAGNRTEAGGLTYSFNALNQLIESSSRHHLRLRQRRPHGLRSRRSRAKPPTNRRIAGTPGQSRRTGWYRWHDPLKSVRPL